MAYGYTVHPRRFRPTTITSSQMQDDRFKGKQRIQIEILINSTELIMEHTVSANNQATHDAVAGTIDVANGFVFVTTAQILAKIYN